MLRFSGSSQNPGSSVLDELQLSNGLLWKACVRDLEGGPNCRVSECQGFITKQRYKRVVIFACDLTTRTE